MAFPLASSGNGCVGADTGLGLGHQGGAKRMDSVCVGGGSEVGTVTAGVLAGDALVNVSSSSLLRGHGCH